jgi:hypothetical protein
MLFDWLKFQICWIAICCSLNTAVSIMMISFEQRTVDIFIIWLQIVFFSDWLTSLVTFFGKTFYYTSYIKTLKNIEQWVKTRTRDHTEQKSNSTPSEASWGFPPELSFFDRKTSEALGTHHLLWMWFLNIWDNVPMDLKYVCQQYFTCMCFLGFIRYNKTFIAYGFRKYENLFTHEYLASVNIIFLYPPH